VNSIRIQSNEAHPDGSRLILAGRITVESAIEFHKCALELSNGDRDVSVSCEAAEYLDVSAIQILLGLGRALAAKQKRFEIVGVSEGLGAWLTLAGLSGASSAR